MKRLLPLFLFLLTLSASAQLAPYTKQVIIVSGGKFGDPNNYVRVGSYDPSTRSFTVFDSIHAASTKSVLSTWDKFSSKTNVFVTADTVILKYNILTHQRLALSPSAKGITYLAGYNNYVLASRGYGADSDYVLVYNASDLSLAYTIKGISGQAAGIAVDGDSAYVAVPGAFGTPTGKIAVINLQNMTLAREINLDTLGAGIDKLFGTTYGSKHVIYAVNDKYNVLITLNPQTGLVTTKQMGKDVGRGFARAGFKDRLYVEVPNAMAEYNPDSNSFVSDTTLLFTKIPGITGSWDIAAIAVDGFDWNNGNLMYASVTDYFSYGRVFVYDVNGKLVDTIETGISPEAIGFYREFGGGFAEGNSNEIKLHLYPNPASSQITCVLPENSTGFYNIVSSTGQVIQSGKFENSVFIKTDIQNLGQGLYFLQVQTNKGTSVARFVRQ
jgi:hypothetical protein